MGLLRDFEFGTSTMHSIYSCRTIFDIYLSIFLFQNLMITSKNCASRLSMFFN